MSETKKIRIVLAALTRLEYSEVLEVPASIGTQDLEVLVQRRYSDVDGGDFQDDPDYWEQGNCYWENCDQADQPDGRVTLENDGEIEVEEFGPATVSQSMAAPDASPSVVVSTGIPEEDQEGGFMNATLQSAGTVAFSVATRIDVPANIAAMGEQAVSQYLASVLWRASAAASALQFEVQVGPSADSA